jgi:hypothetical protein
MGKPRTCRTPQTNAARFEALQDRTGRGIGVRDGPKIDVEFRIGGSECSGTHVLEPSHVQARQSSADHHLERVAGAP